MVSGYDHHPQYHLAAPIGTWMNDPNGPFYDSLTQTYHLFTQFNPYDCVWGNMTWSHWQSVDMLHWTQLPNALSPDHDYDINGVFSGSAFQSINNDDEIELYYTCVDENNEQKQCSARSARSINNNNDNNNDHLIKFIKDSTNPFLSYPAGGNPSEFRDPSLWIENYNNDNINNNNNNMIT